MPANITLCRAIARYPSQKVAAYSWGISPQYLNDMACGRRKVSPRVAVAIEQATGIEALAFMLPQVEADLAKARKSLDASTKARTKKGPGSVVALDPA